MALQSDPSLEGFNSFVSVEEADAHFEGVYFGSGKKWSDIKDQAIKEALLITATRKLNSLPWGGFPNDEDQPLAFPRSFVSGSGEYGYSPGRSTEPSTYIQPWLKQATYDMAQWILTEDDRPATEAEFAMLKAMKLGPIDYTFRDAGSVLPPAVLTLLSTLGSHVIDFGSGPRTKFMVL